MFDQLEFNEQIILAALPFVSNDRELAFEIFTLGLCLMKVEGIQEESAVTLVQKYYSLSRKEKGH